MVVKSRCAQSGPVIALRLSSIKTSIGRASVRMRRSDLSDDPIPDVCATKAWVADPARRRRCKFLQIDVSHRGVLLRQRRARRCNTAPIKEANLRTRRARRGDRDGGIDMNARWQDKT
jgi:hypothetical protein